MSIQDDIKAVSVAMDKIHPVYNTVQVPIDRMQRILDRLEKYEKALELVIAEVGMSCPVAVYEHCQKVVREALEE